MSMELFSQIHFNLHRVFMGCYSTNHLRASFHPHSPKSGVESVMTAGSTSPSDLGFVCGVHLVCRTDPHHQKVSWKVWFL